jgi:hypothetical protein
VEDGSIEDLGELFERLDVGIAEVGERCGWMWVLESVHEVTGSETSGVGGR